MNSDTLFVFSAEQDSTWPFAGTPIDLTFYDSLKAAYPLLDLGQSYGSSSIFAAANLALDTSRTGYLLRVPGMYSSTRIDLWINDPIANTFGPPLELAEKWGDAGEFYMDCSWLVDLNNDGMLDLVQERYRSAVDMETDSLRFETDSLWARLWRGSGFAPKTFVTDPKMRAVFSGSKWLRRQRTPA